jgi:hypothetical protein
MRIRWQRPLQFWIARQGRKKVVREMLSWEAGKPWQSPLSRFQVWSKPPAATAVMLGRAAEVGVKAFQGLWRRNPLSRRVEPATSYFQLFASLFVQENSHCFFEPQIQG